MVKNPPFSANFAAVQLIWVCFALFFADFCLSIPPQQSQQQRFSNENYQHSHHYSSNAHSSPTHHLRTAGSQQHKTHANFFDYSPPSVLNSFGGDSGPPFHMRGRHQVVNKVSCSFEHDMCGWRQQLISSNSNFNWVFHGGPAGANLFQPNIRGDHTTGYGAFMLLKPPLSPIVSSNELNAGSSSLYTPTASTGISGASAPPKAAARAPDPPEVEAEDVLMQRMVSGGEIGGGMGGMGGGHNFGFGGGLPSWLLGNSFMGSPSHSSRQNSPIASLVSGLSSQSQPASADPAASLIALLQAALAGGGGASQRMTQQRFKRQLTKYSSDQLQPSQQRASAQSSSAHGGTRVLEPHEVLAAFRLSNNTSRQMQMQQPKDFAVSPGEMLQQQPPSSMYHNHQLQPPPQMMPFSPPQDYGHFAQPAFDPFPPPDAFAGFLQQNLPSHPPAPNHVGFAHQQHNYHPSMLSGVPPPGMFMPHHPPPPPPQPTAHPSHMHGYGPITPPGDSHSPGGMMGPPRHVSERRNFPPSYPTPQWIDTGTGLRPVIPGYNTQPQEPVVAPPAAPPDPAHSAGPPSAPVEPPPPPPPPPPPAEATGGGQQAVVSSHPNPFAAEAQPANGQQSNSPYDTTQYQPVAQLISPPIFVDGEQINGTFSFWYHLRGAFGRLTVFRRHLNHNSLFLDADETLWEVAGHQSWKWEHVSIQLNSLSTVQNKNNFIPQHATTFSAAPFQIIIEGSLKAGIPTFIGIDDIVLEGEDGPSIPQNNVVQIEAILITQTADIITSTQLPVAASKKSPGVLKPELPLYSNADDRLGPGLMGTTTDDPMTRRHKLMFGARQQPEESTLLTTILTTTLATTTTTTTTTTTKKPLTTTTTTSTTTAVPPFTEWWPPVTILPAAKQQFLFATGKKSSTNQHNQRAKKLNKVPSVVTNNEAVEVVPVAVDTGMVEQPNSVVDSHVRFETSTNSLPSLPIDASQQPAPMRFNTVPNSATDVILETSTLLVPLEREEIVGTPLLIIAQSTTLRPPSVSTRLAVSTVIHPVATSSISKTSFVTVAAKPEGSSTPAAAVDVPITEFNLDPLPLDPQLTITDNATASPSINSTADFYFTEAYDNTTTDVTIDYQTIYFNASTTTLPPVATTATVTTSTTPAYQAYLEALRRSIIQNQKSNRTSKSHMDKTDAVLSEKAGVLDGIAYAGGGVMLMDATQSFKNKLIGSVESASRDDFLLLLNDLNPASTKRSHAALTMQNNLTMGHGNKARSLTAMPPAAAALTHVEKAPHQQRNFAADETSITLSNRQAQPYIASRTNANGAKADGAAADGEASTLMKAVIIFGLSFVGFVTLSFVLIGLHRVAFPRTYSEEPTSSQHTENSAHHTSGKQLTASRTSSGITQASSSFDIYESIRRPLGSTLNRGKEALNVQPSTVAGPRTKSSPSSEVYFLSWSQRGCRLQPTPNEYDSAAKANGDGPRVSSYDNSIHNYYNANNFQHSPMLNTKKQHQWKAAPKINTTWKKRSVPVGNNDSSVSQETGDSAYDNNNVTA